MLSITSQDAKLQGIPPRKAGSAELRRSLAFSSPMLYRVYRAILVRRSANPPKGRHEGGSSRVPRHGASWRRRVNFRVAFRLLRRFKEPEKDLVLKVMEFTIKA